MKTKKRTTRPKMFAEFRNIRVLPSGYQVAITRMGKEVSRHFAGHSEESMKQSVRFRDSLLRKLPDKRLNAVPREALAAAGLKRAIPGVFLRPAKQFYVVPYIDKGTPRTKHFSFATRSEAEAYAEAVAFRRKMVQLANVTSGR